jgi:hypothetical protein
MTVVIPIIIGLLLVVLLILSPFIWWDASQPSFSLNKAEWYCTDSREETHLVMVGKVWIPETEQVCDDWRHK